MRPPHVLKSLCFLAALVMNLSVTGAEQRWSFYATGTMPDESVLFSSDVEPRTAHLLFIPKRIVSVTAADGSVTYDEGKDYTVNLTTGTLTLTDNSRIPCPQLYGGNDKNYKRFKNRQGQGMLFGEGDLFHKLQISVNYEHAGTAWDTAAFVPADQRAKFPVLHAKLAAGKPINLALVGDSISVGYNASGFIKAAPQKPAYGDQVANGIRAHSKNEVLFTNVSKGGMTAPWGLANLNKLEAVNPDVVMIAFGMNDGNRRGKTDQYEKTIRDMIAVLREKNNAVEIVLIANMLPNEEFAQHANHFANRDALKKIAADTERVAVADVMLVTEAMLKRKKFADICGNHVNHPNDFLHRLYASVVLRTLGLDAATP